MTENPVVVSADAKNRALRTLAWGLLYDVAAAVALVVYSAVTSADFAWEKTYWMTVGGLVAKSAVVSLTSYVMRMIKPPPADITHDI